MAISDRDDAELEEGLDGDGRAEQVEEIDVEQDLAAELDRARTEAAEHYDRLLRAQAELQNVIKRHERERIDRAKYACEVFARDLLPIVDDLERALQHAGDQSGGLTQGVELVHRSLLNTLAKHGIERIEAKSQPFDPALHEAVAAVECDDLPENTVVEEHRPGYRIHDRLLRPAMVAVCKAPPGRG